MNSGAKCYSINKFRIHKQPSLLLYSIHSNVLFKVGGSVVFFYLAIDANNNLRYTVSDLTLLKQKYDIKLNSHKSSFQFRSI